MARKQAEEEVEAEGGLRSQMWKHEAFVEWLGEAYNVDLDTLSAAEVIAWFAAKRNEWRKTPGYRGLVNSHKAEAAEAAAERAAARKAAAAEKKAAAPAKKATKATAKAAPAKATKATKKAPAKKATKATATEENPFD